MNVIFGPIKASTSTTSLDGQKVLISTKIRYGIHSDVPFNSFAQLRTDSIVPYVLFNPVITGDYSSYEWEVTKKIGNLAFPRFIFFKTIITNQNITTYYLCPDNTKLLYPMLTLSNISSLNINGFQGFDFISNDFDHTYNLVSGIPKDMISTTSISGPKRITYVVTPAIFQVKPGVIPTTWTMMGIYKVDSQFIIVPSKVYNRKNCDITINSLEIVANIGVNLLTKYCTDNGFTECKFYSNQPMCKSKIDFTNCPKGVKCGTDGCIGSCLDQDTDCVFNDKFECFFNPPPIPIPPTPNPDNTTNFLLIGGIIFVIVIVIIILVAFFTRSSDKK